MANQVKTQEFAAKPTLEKCQIMLDEGLIEMRALLTAGDRHGADDHGKALARVVTVQAELRKQDAEDRRRSETLTASAVYDWFRSVQQSERDPILAEMNRIAQKRSTLA